MNRFLVIVLVTVVAAGIMEPTFSLSGEGTTSPLSPATTPATPAERLKAAQESFQLVFGRYTQGNPRQDGTRLTNVDRKLQIGVPSMGLGTSKKPAARFFVPAEREDVAGIVDYFQKEALLAGALDLSKESFSLSDATPVYGFEMRAGPKTGYLVTVGTAASAAKHLENIRALFEKRASSNAVDVIGVVLESVKKSAESKE